MKIRMIESVRGSLNGVTVDDLEAGRDYETAATAMGQRMGRALVERCVAIELGADGNPLLPPPPVESEPAMGSKPAPAKPRKQ